MKSPSETLMPGEMVNAVGLLAFALSTLDFAIIIAMGECLGSREEAVRRYLPMPTHERINHLNQLGVSKNISLPSDVAADAAKGRLVLNSQWDVEYGPEVPTIYSCGYLVGPSPQRQVAQFRQKITVEEIDALAGRVTRAAQLLLSSMDQQTSRH